MEYGIDAETEMVLEIGNKDHKQKIADNSTPPLASVEIHNPMWPTEEYETPNMLTVQTKSKSGDTVISVTAYGGYGGKCTFELPLTTRVFS